MTTDVETLQQYTCFRDLTTEQQESIAHLATQECFYPSHILSEEGEPGTQLYLLAEGEVEVLYRIGEEGPTRVDQVGPGTIIGCSALVEPYTFTSTTRCLTEIEVLRIDAEALRKLMNEDCTLGLSIQREIIRLLLDRVIDFRLGA